MPNGTYNYTINLPSGYKTTNSLGTLKTTINQTNITIFVFPISHTSLQQSNYNWIIVGVVIVIMLAVIAVVMVVKERKKKDRA